MNNYDFTIVVKLTIHLKVLLGINHVFCFFHICYLLVIYSSTCTFSCICFSSYEYYYYYYNC